jgi:hypothetical protein
MRARDEVKVHREPYAIKRTTRVVTEVVVYKEKRKTSGCAIYMPLALFATSLD